jgi:AcrR family transcriptional regulator
MVVDRNKSTPTTQISESLASSTTPALSRPERHRQRTHQRLLEAARLLVGEHGPDGFTVAELAEAADVGVGTVYNHFGDWRVDPIHAWLASPDELRHQMGLAPGEGAQMPAPQLITRVVTYFVREAQEEPLTAAMLVRLFPTAFWPREQYIAALEQMIGRGIADGDIPDEDIPTLAAATLSLIQGFVFQVSDGTPLQVDSAIRLVLLMLGINEIHLT